MEEEPEPPSEEQGEEEGEPVQGGSEGDSEGLVNEGDDEALSSSSEEEEEPTTVQEEEAMPTWLQEASDTMTVHPPSEIITLTVAPSPPLEEPHAQDPLPRRGKSSATENKGSASSSASTTSTVTSIDDGVKEEDASLKTDKTEEVPVAPVITPSPPRHTSILCDGRVCLELMGLYPPTLLQHFATQRVSFSPKGPPNRPRCSST